MKKFLIKVNGSQYEVEVEEIGKSSVENTSYESVPVAPAAPVAQPRPAAPAPKAAPAAAPSPKSPAPAKNTEVPKGVQTVSAPMPGVILNVNVSAGASVKKGDVLLVLEAMKMENEIVSPSDGTVASVNVTKGASVNAGDVLVSIS